MSTYRSASKYTILYDLARYVAFLDKLWEVFTNETLPMTRRATIAVELQEKMLRSRAPNPSPTPRISVNKQSVQLIDFFEDELEARQ